MRRVPCEHLPGQPLGTQYAIGYQVSVLHGAISCGQAREVLDAAYQSATEADQDFIVLDTWHCLAPALRPSAATPDRGINCHSQTIDVALDAVFP
ncbi:hypothetical protein [Nocardia sp. NPDC056100]|uniref:hypothetical protein n=1 Tax=Nocardia sp. NPDC056100 TaxID=3345712 RepID=UPI0035E23936